MQRVAITAMLRRAGFEVSQVACGEELLELIAARRPDAVVIDAVMPGLSGFETIARIREHPAFSTLPTIVVSGLDDVGSRITALSLGADDFVTKPVHADELAARVRAQLRSVAAWSRSAQAGEIDRATAEWLDDVVDGRRFDVHFQPIVDMQTGRTVAVEALVRFDDGTPPSHVFMSSAPNRRQTELELLVVTRAIELAQVLPDDVRVHVNVSPAAARAPQLGQIVTAARRPMVLEVTEHELFSPEDAAMLRDRIPPSCEIAADDVGAGFSGLTQLVSVRPDVVKIDREIISSIHDDAVRQVIVAGLIRFAATTGASLVAEGVEEREEAAMLLELGVRLGQGYYFGRPAKLDVADSAPPRLTVVRGAG